MSGTWCGATLLTPSFFFSFSTLEPLGKTKHTLNIVNRAHSKDESPKRYQKLISTHFPKKGFTLGGHLKKFQGLNLTPPNPRRECIFPEKSVVVTCPSVSEALRAAGALCVASNSCRVIYEQTLYATEAKKCCFWRRLSPRSVFRRLARC